MRRRHGVTLTELARRAEMNPSSLTQFYNREERSGTLQTLSIRRIADAWGERVPSEVVGETDGRGGGFDEPEALAFEYTAADPFSALIEQFCSNRPALVPWELRSRALEAVGFMPGDVLVMDLNAKPEPGDVVCAQVYDMVAMRAETVFRVFEPPFLVGAGDDAWRKPLMAQGGQAAIKAVMISSFRRRTARTPPA